MPRRADPAADLFSHPCFFLNCLLGWESLAVTLCFLAPLLQVACSFSLWRFSIGVPPLHLLSPSWSLSPSSQLHSVTASFTLWLPRNGRYAITQPIELHNYLFIPSLLCSILWAFTQVTVICCSPGLLQVPPYLITQLPFISIIIKMLLVLFLMDHTDFLLKAHFPHLENN